MAAPIAGVLSLTSTATPPRPVTFHVETWQTFYPAVLPLFQAHWQEVALHQDRIPLVVDAARYQSLSDADILLIVTARAAGVLVGYWMGFVLPHLHYADTLHATMDIVYVQPAYRKGFLAWRLFKYVEARCQARGVVRVSQGTKVHAGLDLSRLYTRLGYEHTENHFTKLL